LNLNAYIYTKKRVKKIKKIIGDSVSVKKQRENKYQLSELHEVIENNHYKNTQTLLLGGERTVFFVTEDSRKYISLTQQYKKKSQHVYIDPRGRFDSVHMRYVKVYSADNLQQRKVVSEFRSAQDITNSFREALSLDMSPIRMWQVSLAGAVLFGMVSMSMIYKNLGQSAMAKVDDEAMLKNDKSIERTVGEQVDEVKITKKEKTDKKKQDIEDQSLVEKDDTEDKNKSKEDVTIKKVEKVQQKDKDEVVNTKSIDSVQKKQVIKNDEDEDKSKDEENVEDMKVDEEYSLEQEAYEMVGGYPIEEMLPYILKQDPEVAKYMIAMAKQESQWGKRVPVLNGQDCYNYWGYRSKRKLMGSGGHTCFNSRKDAVETVGRRINELIYKYDRKTAERLIVWKCGSTCAGHSQSGVDRWINVVGTYYDKLSKK